MKRPRKPSGIGAKRNAVRLAVIVLAVIGFGIGAGWGVACGFGIETVAAVCPLGALESFLAAKCAMPRTVIAVLCALVVIALFGRTFCAWVCPVPPIGKFFRPGAAARRAAEEREEGVGGAEPDACSESCSKGCATCSLEPVGGKRDGVHVDTRHAVLLGALASSAVFGFPVFCLVCPIGLTFGTLFAVWTTFANHDPSWALLVFPAILLLELVVFRKWCHVLCPVGALLSLVGAKAPIGKPRVDGKRCLRSQGVDCHACVEACPEELDPHARNHSECTRCGLCAEACPAGAISFRCFGRKGKRGDAGPRGHAVRRKSGQEGS